jgi:hypothetical protein
MESDPTKQTPMVASCVPNGFLTLRRIPVGLDLVLNLRYLCVLFHCICILAETYILLRPPVIRASWAVYPLHSRLGTILRVARFRCGCSRILPTRSGMSRRRARTRLGWYNSLTLQHVRAHYLRNQFVLWHYTTSGEPQAGRKGHLKLDKIGRRNADDSETKTALHFSIMQDIVQAGHYGRPSKVIHRDQKSENVWLHKYTSAWWIRMNMT